MSSIPGETRLEELAAAAAALSGELDLDTVLQSVVEIAARVTGAQYAALGVIGESETIVRFVTRGIDNDGIAAIGHYPTGKGLLGLLIREPRIIRLEDLNVHPAAYGFPANHPPMTTFLGAPVSIGGRVYGNLYLTDKPDGFTVADEQVIAVLASQAGAAIENALLSARLRVLAVHEERERISRELHDGAIQMLFSVGMGLQSARALVPINPSEAERRIDSAVDGIDQTMRDLRSAIFKLQPHDAASLGLSRGVAELAREHEVNALVRPSLDLETDLDARVPTALTPDLLAIVREALANSAKHARARNVWIGIRVREGMIHCVVADDGSGFDQDLVSAGRGLGNIRERVAGLGGQVRLTTAFSEGTRIELAIPVGSDPPPSGSADQLEDT